MQEMLCLCSKTYCSYGSLSKMFTLSSKNLNKQEFEENGDGQKAKYRKLLDGTENVTATNHDFRTKNRCVVNYEQTKNGLSYFNVSE